LELAGDVTPGRLCQLGSRLISGAPKMASGIASYQQVAPSLVIASGEASS
jgi:hypothetical protein